MSGSTSSNIIGSGSDTIVLKMAEDQAQGVDANFTVNVDGQQIGGLQTVTALQSAGQTEAFTFAGNYAPGSHVVTVTFANNFLYPGTGGDRNAYVDGVTYDGQSVSNATTGIYETPLFPPNSTAGNIYGNAQFTVNDTTSIPNGASSSTTTPAPVSVGGGADTLALNMAEDPYQGDAQFTVSVDGQQVGGTLTTTAIVDQGQSQEFDIHGNFGGGSHTVTVNFLNDYIGGYYPAGTPGLPPGGPWAIDTEDRNLYVMGASLDGGTPASGAPWEESGDGPHDFYVTAGANPSATDATSGLFGSNGGATAGSSQTSDGSNVAITPGSLSAGTSSSSTSSGMSFVASPTTSPAPTPTPTPTATNTTVTTGAPTVASTTSGTAQTTQDFSVPTTPTPTPTPTSTGSSSSSTSTTYHVAHPAHHHHA